MGDEVSLGKGVFHENKNLRKLGLLGWTFTVCGSAIYFFWAFFDHDIHQQFGMSFPDRYWALALPAWFSTAFFYVGFMYISLNFMVTASLDSLDTITDEYSFVSNPSSQVAKGIQTHIIPAISDIDIIESSRLLSM